MVAAVSNGAMATGLYPAVPHVAVALQRRRAGASAPAVALRHVAREWAVSVAMSAARPLGFFDLPGRRGQGRPVILVHGYAMNRANFVPLAARLARAELGPVLGFEYWSLGRVASAARRLSTYVDGVCAATGSDTVDIIGHSMGGIVGRYYLTLGSGARRVRNLVTLGTPHRGADLSGVGFGRPSRELLPGSAFLQRLGAAPIPPTARVTAIWSHSDCLVSSNRNARLQGAGVEEIVFDDLGHLSLLASRRVAAAVIDRLRRP
ncbi:MAG TPA: alpha/beta fold hydrolase [Kofleriaceae bacterium]|nr:alpha/beta fold hydrolase [Kofleriaceae bacterium]